MTPLPLLAAGLAVFLGARVLARRRQKNVIRLRDGGRIKLLSAVALLDGSEGDLLALEYASDLTDPPTGQLRHEALALVRTVGARTQYATCRSALVSVSARRSGERVSRESTFTFVRSDSGSDWYPADG